MAEDPISATDAIIEELKTLARSMLEATNAARRKSRVLETHKSYEALLNVIDGKRASERQEGREATTGAATSMTSNANVSNSCNAAAFDESSAAAGVVQPIVQNVRKVYYDPVHGDTTPKAPQNMAAVDNVRRTVIEAAISSLHYVTDASVKTSQKASSMQVDAPQSAEGKPKGEDGVEGRDDNEVSSDLLESAVGGESHGRSAATALEAPVASAEISHSLAETPADEETSAFDGVRTQVLFRPTEPVLYERIRTSTWKPEALLRYADGTAEPDTMYDDEDDNADKQARGGDDATASVSTRRRSGRRGGAMRVWRVPSYPFGGGITERQAASLYVAFDKCTQARKLAGSPRRSPVATRPQLITMEALRSGEYDEVCPFGAQRDFQPASPYDFVVELERDVIFDAVRARAERRRAFRQLVQEHRAPMTMGTFDLRIIMDPLKTGFEDEKTLPIIRGDIIADRYEVIKLLGKATFSRAVRCYDLHQPIYDDDDDDDDASEHEEGEENESSADQNEVREEDEEEGRAGTRKSRHRRHREPVGYVEVCLKIINNSKDFFDQSLDEIRLLTLINKYQDPDEVHVVRLVDAFYHREHMMLVTELLSDNLYEYGKYIREEGEEPYFTLPRLRRIARQVTEALAYVHSLNLIHADLKPENILFVSHRQCTVKVIDFGSSCFLSDHLSSYIQSRSYRAPEVVLGCDYDGRIDVWSLGAILVELVTGNVLFTSETVPEMLARIVYICGMPLPRRMLWEGRHTNTYINKFGCIYEAGSAHETSNNHNNNTADESSEEPYFVYTPVIKEELEKPRRDDSIASSSSSSASSVSQDDKVNGESSGAPCSYSVLREKLAAAGMTDPLFLSFVQACLTLDHKRRPTSKELLQHPFLNMQLEEEAMEEFVV